MKDILSEDDLTDRALHRFLRTTNVVLVECL